MKTRNSLEVKGVVTAGALALALSAAPSFAAELDGHTFVRDSIRNTWTPTAVALQTEGKTDAHERARTTIVGTTKSPSTEPVASTADGSRVAAHEQARRLLLAQPGVSRQPVVASDSTPSGS